MLRYVVLSAAVLAVLPAAGQAQTPQYDGYCYVRSADMKRNTVVDDSGTPRAAARCLKGEYYAYTDNFKAAPRAPQGYVVEYFTRRPNRSLYDTVYNAATLTQNFEPGAQNNFGNRAYSDSTYADNATTSVGRRYSDNAYVSGGYADQAYANQAYSGRAYSGNTTSGSRDYTYNNAYSRDDAYADEQPGAVASSSYGYDDDRQFDDNGGRVNGWRDDAGRWHAEQPAAIGWRDNYGQWHVGQVSAYGWQDDDGQWHEDSRDDGYGQGVRSDDGERD